MIRLGLLGAGRIGQIHGRNAAAHRGARLVAVADAVAASAASLAKATGAAARSVDEVIAAKDVDAVLICTSTDTHADLIDRSAKAGKAIFCEKPVDLSAKRIALSPVPGVARRCRPRVPWRGITSPRASGNRRSPPPAPRTRPGRRASAG